MRLEEGVSSLVAGPQGRLGLFDSSPPCQTSATCLHQSHFWPSSKIKDPRRAFSLSSIIFFWISLDFVFRHDGSPSRPGGLVCAPWGRMMGRMEAVVVGWALLLLCHAQPSSACVFCHNCEPSDVLCYVLRSAFTGKLHPILTSNTDRMGVQGRRFGMGARRRWGSWRGCCRSRRPRPT